MDNAEKAVDSLPVGMLVGYQRQITEPKALESGLAVIIANNATSLVLYSPYIGLIPVSAEQITGYCADPAKLRIKPRRWLKQGRAAMSAN